MGKEVIREVLLISVFLFFGKTLVLAQSNCTSATPSFTVDLSSSPYAYWDSPLVTRDGQCCVTSNSCVEFIVSLHPLAGGVVLQITSGAIPSGSMYYRADCGYSTAVGDSMCLTGAGPFSITFCKPGGNPNTYRISSFARPAASPDLQIHAGCSVNLWSVGFNQSSISWNSISPGTPGAYNSWLSCTLHCDTVVFTPGTNPPAYIDFRVSGTPQNACSVVLADTVRIYIHDTLWANIIPDNPTVCYDSTTTTLSCTLSGGLSPYTVQWSNSSNSFTAHLPPGNHWMSYHDQSSCPADTIFFAVNQVLQPPSVEAGDDIYVCYDEPLIELNAISSGALGVLWSGGSGSFLPSATTSHVWYQPSINDRLNGLVTLTVTTIGNENCVPATDQITIFFRSKPVTSLISHY